MIPTGCGCRIRYGPGNDDYGRNRPKPDMSNNIRWDGYFLNVAKAVGSNSKCHSRKIGAIIVKDKAIISTGYNGPPAGVPICYERQWKDTMVIDKMLEMDLKVTKDHICPRHMFGFKSGEGLQYCIAGHAERNAIIQAAKNGISTLSTTMYMDCPIPCKDCLIEIINAGIAEAVVTSMDFYDEASKYLLEQSNLLVRPYYTAEETG